MMVEYPPSRPWDEFLKERLQDPAFATAYYEMEPEFQAARREMTNDKCPMTNSRWKRDGNDS
jgi:hypothetical protein